MKVENIIMLTEINQTQKAKESYVLSYFWKLKQNTTWILNIN